MGEVVRESVEALGVAQGLSVGEIGASIGVACHDPNAEKLPDALREADSAMYRAKELGGNVVVLAGDGKANGNEER